MEGIFSFLFVRHGVEAAMNADEDADDDANVFVDVRRAMAHPAAVRKVTTAKWVLP